MPAVLEVLRTSPAAGSRKICRAILPDGLDAEIDLAAWTPQPVFGWLAKSAGIAEQAMLRTFNCGIGLIVVANEIRAGHVIDAFQENGDRATRLGTLVAWRHLNRRSDTRAR